MRVLAGPLPAAAFLIPGIAVEGTRAGSGRGTDGGTFQGAARLVAYHAADGGTEQASGGGTALGVRTGGSRALGKGTEGSGGEDEVKCDFHGESFRFPNQTHTPDPPACKRDFEALPSKNALSPGTTSADARRIGLESVRPPAYRREPLAAHRTCRRGPLRPIFHPTRAMFSSLADSLDKTFRNLRGVGKISEKNIADALREIRIALLEADVEFSVAKDFIARVKEKSLGEEVLKSIKPGEQIVKIFQDELTALLGGDQAPLDLNPPGRILLCGLNGAGKTTTAAKLALRLKKQGRKPGVVACDLYRPAAIEQLATLARQAEVPCFTPEPGETDVLRVAREALPWAQRQGLSVLIFDTAGRQELDERLIEELKALHAFLTPRETLLVADSATGQQAVSVATTFDQAVGLSGIVLTRLDGDTRGGAALSMRAVTGKPIKFIGEGEKLDQLAEFHPDRMADRILGMGDIVGMVEQVAMKVNEQDAMHSMKRMQEGRFDFNDFLHQMKMIRNLGPLDGLLGMMPGFNKIKKQLPGGALDNSKLKRTEAIVLSMTPTERSRPEIIKGSRRQRIAAGAGVSLMEVNQLLKQFGEMRKLMKSPQKMKSMMRQMGGMAGKGMPGGMGGLGDLLKGLGGKPPF